MKTEMTAARLRELLHYDPETGVFTWKAHSRRNSRVGMAAGSACTKGYLQVRIDGRLHLAHRLAVLYTTGSWPEEQVDHINGDKTDNRLCNLRCCTGTQNAKNRGIQSNCSAKAKGVWRQADRYRVRIESDGKRYELGVYETLDAAKNAYNTAAAKLHGAFANLQP